MTRPYPNAVIQIFSKAPVPGQVKTRLIPALTAEQAAAVQRELTLATLDLATEQPLCPVQLWCAPDVEHSFFQAIRQHYPVSLHTQCAGDLGQRMVHALQYGIAQYGGALLMGSDCPSLRRQDLEQALVALRDGYECVLAATEDGGYCLLGLTQPIPALFRDIRWSTDSVCAETEAVLQRLKTRYYCLPQQWDVDTYPDYLRYQRLRLESR